MSSPRAELSVAPLGPTMASRAVRYGHQAIHYGPQEPSVWAEDAQDMGARLYVAPRIDFALPSHNGLMCIERHLCGNRLAERSLG
jgi:hypothetical protein